MKNIAKIIIGILVLGLAVWGVLAYRPEILQMLGMEEEQKIVQNDEQEIEISDTPQYRNPTYQEYITRGMEYQQNGFWDFAIQEYFGAMEIEPENSEAYTLLGKAQMQIRDWRHAVMSLENAREYGDNTLDTVSTLVRALIQNGDFEEAHDAFLEFDEGSMQEEVLYLRGLLAILDNNREITGGSFRKLLQMYPNSEYKDAINKYLEAYEEFDLFQDGHPTHIKALLARALNENEQYTMAVEVLKGVIQEKGDYRDAWILLGYAQYAREEYTAAKNALEKAVELDPTKPESQYFLGLTYAELGEKDSAIDALEMALEDGFTPETQIISKLAQVYLDNQNYLEAAQTYEDYLNKGGDEILTNYVRPVWIYLDYVATEDGVNKAVEIARRATEKFPDQALAHNLLGWSLIYAEGYEEAFTELNKAKAIDPNMAAVYLNFGIWYEKQGSNDLAKENYNEAYEKGNGDSISNSAAQRYNEIIEQEETESEEEITE